MTGSKSTTQIIYKTIAGYEGYRFGDDGSVWSRWNGGGTLSSDWHRLRGTPSTHYGHTKVEVKFNGKRVMRSVHRLILEAFVGPCPPGLEACHGPGGKLDNRIDNLRWDTHKSNIRDKVRDGTQSFGERHHSSKITELQAANVIRLSKTPILRIRITDETGVPYDSVLRIIDGTQWRYLQINDKWKDIIKHHDCD